jgi:hypothetical protein
MITLEQFKNENQNWLEMIIGDYTNVMEWQEGMNSHPSDYFNDTRYYVSEKFKELGIEDNELLNEVQNYIEGEVISRLK